MRISPINNAYPKYKQNFRADYKKKENNVVILGSSKTSYEIVKPLIQCSDITRRIIVSGKNVITGCCTGGIMGQAYYTAAELSDLNENGKPEQNLVILKDPLWGDEDLENCIVIDKANSEAERIQKFIETADSFVVFPGAPGTLQEVSTLIFNNYYNPENRKKVILVGSEYFNGLNEQYKEMHNMGLIKCDVSELYTITDDVNEVMKTINKD